MDIQFREVNYTYQAGTTFAQPALQNINLTIEFESFTAVIGKTGSGKSTLLQHFNALLQPTEGVVRIGGIVITPQTGNTSLKALRKKVGTVFQFPESQLFGQTVAEDIAFGPQNYGASEKQALAIARETLEQVGLDESFLDRSPFDLSGGQQRRVAIAGVLALEPDILVLDEPTAGLDPEGQKEMLEIFSRLNKEQNKTIILVTHRMEDVAQYADDVIVMEKGTAVRQAPPREIFTDEALLERNRLDVPDTIKFAFNLEKEYGWRFNPLPLTTDALAKALKNKFTLNLGDEL
jgi:energy-coupling factor transport system ATP-binding protein